MRIILVLVFSLKVLLAFGQCDCQDVFTSLQYFNQNNKEAIRSCIETQLPENGNKEILIQLVEKIENQNKIGTSYYQTLELIITDSIPSTCIEYGLDESIFSKDIGHYNLGAYEQTNDRTFPFQKSVIACKITKAYLENYKAENEKSITDSNTPPPSSEIGINKLTQTIEALEKRLSFSSIVTIIALVLALISVLFLIWDEGRRKKVRDDLKDINLRISNLQNLINNNKSTEPKLSPEISGIETQKSKSIEKEADIRPSNFLHSSQINKNKRSKEITTNSDQPESGPKYFVGAPQNDLFQKIYNDLQPQTTFFEITTSSKNPSEGTFKLVDDEETLKAAFNIVDTSLRSACDLVGSGKPTSKTVKVNPGKVVKDRDFWRIVQKAELSW